MTTARLMTASNLDLEHSFQGIKSLSLKNNIELSSNNTIQGLKSLIKNKVNDTKDLKDDFSLNSSNKILLSEPNEVDNTTKLNNNSFELDKKNKVNSNTKIEFDIKQKSNMEREYKNVKNIKVYK